MVGNYVYNPFEVSSRDKYAGKTQGRYIRKYENAAIALSASWLVVKDNDADSVNFAPFDAVNIVNLSDNDITVVYDNNTNRADVVPARCIFTRGDKASGDTVIFRSLTITNRSAVLQIDAAKVIVTVEKRGGALI